MGKSEIERYLSHLAINRAVSASTQAQAMNAILFLYRHVLDLPPVDELAPVRSRKSRRLPTVPSGKEMRPSRMHGTHKLVTETMYAGGLRLGEALRLRVHDLDFDHHQLFITDSKGEKIGRRCFLPSCIRRIARTSRAPAACTTGI